MCIEVLDTFRIPANHPFICIVHACLMLRNIFHLLCLCVYPYVFVCVLVIYVSCLYTCTYGVIYTFRIPSNIPFICIVYACLMLRNILHLLCSCVYPCVFVCVLSIHVSSSLYIIYNIYIYID